MLNLPLLAFNAKKYVFLEPARYSVLMAAKDHGQPASPRRNGDIPEVERSQEGTSLRALDPDDVIGTNQVRTGIVHQARLPPDHVLLLPLLHDRCLNKGRDSLTQGGGGPKHETWRKCLTVVGFIPSCLYIMVISGAWGKAWQWGSFPGRSRRGRLDEDRSNSRPAQVSFLQTLRMTMSVGRDPCDQTT